MDHGLVLARVRRGATDPIAIPSLSSSHGALAWDARSAARWAHRAQVSRVGGLVGDVLEAGWRWFSVYPQSNGQTGLFLAKVVY